ncbi:MAG: hypothetical protein ACRCTE_03875 [Cellulosilyticaceae bacterium]
MIQSTLLKETLLLLGGLSAMAVLYFNRQVLLNVLINELNFSFLTNTLQSVIFMILLLLIIGSSAYRILRHIF